MSDVQRTETARAAAEAAETAGHPHARGRAGDIEAGLMRYLAAEAYHEKAAETREADQGGPDETG